MKKNQGFTLIELMIVVAIIGILAAIAVPQYNEYVTKSRMTEAFNTLSDLRTRMEQYYQDNRAYNNGAACGVTMPTAPAVTNFTYACALTNANQGFTLTATGVTTRSVKGFTYTVNETNLRATTSVPTGYTANPGCWVSSKGGC